MSRELNEMRSSLHQYWKGLEATIHLLLASEEGHVKEINTLKSDLNAYKEAWTSLEKSNHDSKADFLRRESAWEKEKRDLETQITVLKGLPRRVVCLIDGDGTIFRPDLIAQGEDGGYQAAQTLTKYIQEYLSNDGLEQHQLWTYIFLNKRGLVDAFSRAGHGQEAKEFDKFAIGFNKAGPFLMIDVGSGKEVADTKIKALLDDNIRLPQTARILFGGCHDNGYVATLRSLMTEGFREKLILLPGYQEIAIGIQELQLPIITTSKLFLSHKLENPPVNARSMPPPAQTNAISWASALHRPPGLNNTFSTRSPTLSGALPASVTYSSALQAPVDVPARRPTSPRSESGSTASSDRILDLAKGISSAKMTPTRRYIIPDLPLSKHKPPPCTLHYLATCKHESSCRYSHDYLLNDEHYEEMRRNAQKAPCPALNKDEECTWGDKCIYGHKCPEGGNCRFEQLGRCKFVGSDMHGYK